MMQLRDRNMRSNEWNARLHGLVVFRSLLDDAVVAKLVDLTDRMASGTPGCSAVCDAVAQFEAALFEHTTNWGDYQGRTSVCTSS